MSRLKSARLLRSDSVPVRGAVSDIREIIHRVRTPEPANVGQTARAVIEALVTAGVDTFFGIPGGPAAPLFEALDQVVGARLIESRQETAAVFEAIGYFRATGRVPAVMVTAGPGATQAVTGIVNASLARVPMIVISGDVSWSAAGGRMLQDSGPEGIAIEEMLAKATRMQVRVARPESAVSQTLAALDAAIGADGPALVVIPVHHAAALGGSLRMVRSQRPPARFEIDAESVRETCEILSSAERPLIVIGSGCRNPAASIRQHVDALDVPFVTTPAAKGIVSEEHPRSLRHGGLAASQWARAYINEGIDGCLVLGSDLDDVSIGPTRYIAEGGRLVHVDLDARVFQRNLPTELGVVADVETFSQELRSLWTQNGYRNGKSAAVVRLLKQRIPAFDVPDFRSDEKDQIAPHRAIADLERAVPGAMFVSDIGEHMLFALHYLTAKGPDAFHIQLALGSMGSGIASSIGLAVGGPNRRLVCICGDGGMQMFGMEALVAVRERLPIVFAVFNDGRYNMVHHGMKQLYGRARDWSAPEVDFAKWGDAIGMATMRVDNPGQIDEASIDALLASGGPVLLDIRIDRELRIKGAGRVEALQQMSAHNDGGSR